MKVILVTLLLLNLFMRANAQTDWTYKNLSRDGTMGLSERNFSVSDSIMLLNLSATVRGLQTSTGSTYINLSDYAKTDGTDQALQIQAAVNAAQVQGKALYIPEGTFSTSNTIKITSSNITIIGSGNASILKAINTSPTPPSGSTAMRVLMQVNYRSEWYGRTQDRLKNINLRDFVLDMSSITPDYQAGWNDGITGRGALYCVSVDHMNIDNVFINEAVTSGLTLSSCFNVKVTKVTINGLRAKIIGYNLIYDGNGININSIPDESFTYTGPIGSINLDNCTVIGNTNKYSTTITNNVPSSGANIGIETNLGNDNESKRLKDVSITNCKVLKWYWGIMAEGMNAGGAGDVIIAMNTINEAVHGIWLFGNSNATDINIKNVIISNNRIKNIYHTPIAIWGIQASVTSNLITNWAIAPSNSQLKNVAGLDGVAAAIYILPHPNGYSNALTGSNYIIANNICVNEYTNTSAYAFAPIGMWLRAYKSVQTLNNVQITGNIFDLGGVTHVSSIGVAYNAGILLDGKITNSTFSNNLVKGAGFCAIGTICVPSNGIENFAITNNRFINNNYALSSSDYIIRIASSNTGIRIEGNEFTENAGNRGYGAVLFEYNEADVGADYITIRNNKVRGIGDCMNVFSLNVTGKNIIIEGNENYNYRSSAPSSPAYKGFRGTIIHNKDVTPAGIYAWICTSTGRPGTWTPLHFPNPNSVSNTGSMNP